MYIYIYLYTCIHIYMFIYIYIYVYIHTYTSSLPAAQFFNQIHPNASFGKLLVRFLLELLNIPNFVVWYSILF